MSSEEGIETCPKCGGQGEESRYKEAVIEKWDGNSVTWCSCYYDEDCKHPERLPKCRDIFGGYYPCRKCKGEGVITWIDRVFRK